MTNDIIVALINAGGAIIASIIAATVAIFIGKKFENQKKLKEKLYKAVSDIQFLLKVEEIHCADKKDIEDTLGKNTARSVVREEYELEYSGEFSPSRARDILDDIKL